MDTQGTLTIKLVVVYRDFARVVFRSRMVTILTRHCNRAQCEGILADFFGEDNREINRDNCHIEFVSREIF